MCSKLRSRNLQNLSIRNFETLVFGPSFDMSGTRLQCRTFSPKCADSQPPWLYSLNCSDRALLMSLVSRYPAHMGSSETMAQLKQTMNNNTTVLEKLVQQNSHFRVTKPLRAPQSIFDLSFTTQSIPYDDEGSMIGSTLFTFDDEVVNSQAYRRALTKVSTHSKGMVDSPNANSGHGADPAVKVISAAAQQSKDSGRHKASCLAIAQTLQTQHFFHRVLSPHPYPMRQLHCQRRRSQYPL